MLGFSAFYRAFVLGENLAAGLLFGVQYITETFNMCKGQRATSGLIWFGTGASSVLYLCCGLGTRLVMRPGIYGFFQPSIG